jgi:hypothetical protein
MKQNIFPIQMLPGLLTILYTILYCLLFIWAKNLLTFLFAQVNILVLEP